MFLNRLRGSTADLRLELSILQSHVLSRTAHTSTFVVIRSLKRPVLIACGLMFFQRFSGANAFYFYAVSVFKETFGSTDAHGAAVAVAIVQLLSSLLSGLLVDTAGRLPLLVASSVLMSLALASFGSFAYYEDAHPKGIHFIPNYVIVMYRSIIDFRCAAFGLDPIAVCAGFHCSILVGH